MVKRIVFEGIICFDTFQRLISWILSNNNINDNIVCTCVLVLRLSGFIMFPTRSDHAMLIFAKLAISREIDIGLVGITGNTSPKDVEIRSKHDD